MGNVYCSICNKKIEFTEGKHVGLCNLCTRLYDDISDNEIQPDAETVLKVVDDYFAHQALLSTANRSRMLTLLKRCEQTGYVLRKREEICDQVAEKTKVWINLFKDYSLVSASDPFCLQMATDIICFYKEHGTRTDSEEKNYKQVSSVGYRYAEKYLTKYSQNYEECTARTLCGLLMFLQSISSYEGARELEQKAKELLSKFIDRMNRTAGNDKENKGEKSTENIGYYYFAEKLLLQYGDRTGKRLFASKQLYDEAVLFQQEGIYAEAYSRLLLIPDYMDASERMEEMKPLIYQQAREITGNSELTGVENEDEEDRLFEENLKARDLFGMIDPYEDSEKQIVICDMRLEKLFDMTMDEAEEKLDDMEEKLGMKPSGKSGYDKNLKIKAELVFLGIAFLAVVGFIVIYLMRS